MDRLEWDRMNAHRRLDGEPELPWDPDASPDDRRLLMQPDVKPAKAAEPAKGARHETPKAGAKKDS